MKRFKLYEDNTLVTIGTADELADRLITDRTNIYMAAKSERPLFKRFKVIEMGEDELIETPKEEKPRKSKHQQKLEYLIWHLEHYGNTSLKGDPREYLNELSERGIDIYYHKSVFSNKDYILERI